MKRTVTIIDPPMGWRFGFPRVFDIREGESEADWFVRRGYPKEHVELALKYSRTWTQEASE